MKCETNFRTIGGGFAKFSHPLASPHHPKIPPEWVKNSDSGIPKWVDNSWKGGI